MLRVRQSQLSKGEGLLLDLVPYYDIQARGLALPGAREPQLCQEVGLQHEDLQVAEAVRLFAGRFGVPMFGVPVSYRP